MVLQEALVEQGVWEALSDLGVLPFVFDVLQVVDPQPELVISGERVGTKGMRGEEGEREMGQGRVPKEQKRNNENDRESMADLERLRKADPGARRKGEKKNALKVSGSEKDGGRAERRRQQKGSVRRRQTARIGETEGAGVKEQNKGGEWETEHE